MKRKSIRKKITKLLLYSVTAVLLVTSTLALMNLLAMKIVFDERSRELGNKAAGDAELAMENIAGEHLLNTSIDKATLIEEKMDTMFASQLPDSAFTKVCKTIIDNNSDIENIEKQLEKLCY